MALNAPLPILVAHVADEGARAHLLGVARNGGDAHITLASAPADSSPHLLEVHAPGLAPLRFVAVPLGPPTNLGWPLRLTLAEEPAPASVGGVRMDIPDLDIAPGRLALRVPPSNAAVDRVGADIDIDVDISSLAVAPISERELPAVGVVDEFDWMERGSSGYPSGPPTGAPSKHPAHAIDLEPAPSSTVAPSNTAAPAPTNPNAIAPFLRRLAETTDPDEFAALVAPLAPSIKGLADRGQANAAWRLCSTLEVVAAEPPPPPGAKSRGEIAKLTLEHFRHPQILAPLAAQVLDANDADGSAQRLVVRAGKRGARALYQARLTRNAPDARTRFVAVLQTIGPPSLPMFKTAFEHLGSRLEIAGAVAMGEDLLRALVVPDDAMGQIVASYMQVPHPSLAIAATEAIARVWGAKAREPLAAQMARYEPEIAIAAMAQLRAMNAIGPLEVERLRGVVTGALAVPLEVRRAAIESMAIASPDARPAVHAILYEALARTIGPSPEIDQPLLMISWALLTTGANPAPVVERYNISEGPLRAQLEQLLRMTVSSS